MEKKKEVLIIIPAYNEEKTITALLEQLEKPEISELADVLVMNDASSDSTNWITKKRNHAVVTHVFNLGYGSGLQLGYKYAVRKKYQYVIQMDADGQHDVCNIPAIYKALHEKGVEVRGDERIREIVPEIVPATEEDWGTEYLDAIISVKTVSSIEEAIAHINKYNTGHSESIITKDYTNALKFQDEIDAAAVYVNASTRFTDGFEFGFGAEIGISTQKLHARGPMGLEALTTTKYVIFGDGQIRP